MTISPVAGYVQIWAAFAWAQVSFAALFWHRFILAVAHLSACQLTRRILRQALGVKFNVMCCTCGCIEGWKPQRVRWDICGAKLHMLGTKVIGIVACIVCYSSCELLKKIGLDDALDVRGARHESRLTLLTSCSARLST